MCIFHQICTILGAPGRVVNLMHTDNDNDKVWGVAYEVDDELWEKEICAQLDHREKGGYTQHRIQFHPKDQTETPKEVTIYLGDKSNRQYAGPDSLDVMASTILNSVGPSGQNKEYLYNLAEAMLEIDPNDTHLYELDRAVKKLDKQLIS